MGHTLSFQSTDLGVNGGELLRLGHFREFSPSRPPPQLFDFFGSPWLERRPFFRRHFGIEGLQSWITCRGRGLNEERIFFA